MLLMLRSHRTMHFYQITQVSGLLTGNALYLSVKYSLKKGSPGKGLWYQKV